MSKNYNRRNFLKKGAAAGLGVAFGSMALDSVAKTPLIGTAPKIRINKPMEKVRMGLIGIGGMGSAHLRNFLKIDNCEIKAVCDIVEEKVKKAQKMHEEAGKPIPDGYFNGEYDYKRMCERDDLDLIYIVTPWKWHVPAMT